MMRVCLALALLVVTVAAVEESEEETFHIMLDASDYLAHHPEKGFLNHHEMDENVPLLLQLDEDTVLQNVIPEHCHKPVVEFDSFEAEVEQAQGASDFLEIQSALAPAAPANPTKPMDLSTLLPLAAGAYFLANGGMGNVENMMKQSGIGTKEMMSALPVLLSLGSAVTGGTQGGGGMGQMAQLLPMIAPMLMGGGGGGGGGGGMQQMMQMMGGAGGGGGGGGMQQLMQMAPQIMQMMGGAGGGGGGGGGMQQMMQMMGGAGGGGGMGGNAALAAQLLPMMMGGGGGGM